MESYFGIRVVVVVLLVALNGFFAGTEICLLSVRSSRLRQRAAEGSTGAQAALNLLAHPARLLSVTQVGVTLASLGLGWAGEGTLYDAFIALFHPLLNPATSRLLHALCFLLAFLVMSYFHVVLGEVVPKNIAIEASDRLAPVVAPALLVFYRIAAPFVIIIEKSSAALSHAIGSVERHHSGGHSAEELKLIVTSSRGLGYLPEAEEDMIHRVLDLRHLLVREIMKPRKDIISIPDDASLEQVLTAMIEHQHSRLPVYHQTPERIVGIVHYKDLLPVWEERRAAVRRGRPARNFIVTRMMRKPLFVPETKPLTQMLADFKGGKSHMAIVVNEFGTVTGLLTVEDVLEQIVGEIEDEHDEKIERPAPEASEVELDGGTRIRDLGTEYGILIPSDAGFETLAGFLLFRLGAIPKVGDTADVDGRRYTVLEMDRNRIARVRIEKLPAREALRADSQPPDEQRSERTG
jgi:CBS domain containing-hemolysin-like protein